MVQSDFHSPYSLEIIFQRSIMWFMSHYFMFNIQAWFYSASFCAVGDSLFLETFFFLLGFQGTAFSVYFIPPWLLLVFFVGTSFISHLHTLRCQGLSSSPLHSPTWWSHSGPQSYAQPDPPLGIQDSSIQLLLNLPSGVSLLHPGSSLEYCSNHLFSSLCPVLHRGVRVTFKQCKSDHVTPLVKTIHLLQWLFRIKMETFSSDQLGSMWSGITLFYVPLL